MALTKITTHNTDAIARLVEQYRDKTNMRALVSAFAVRMQATEDSLWDLFTLRDIDSATLNALDQLGAIVKQARQSADDAAYRPYVRSRIRINRSSGVGEDLIEVLKLVYPGVSNIHLTDFPPAGFRIDLVGDPITAEQAETFTKFIKEARAAGVGGVILWNESARDFRLDTGENYETWDVNAGAHVSGDLIIGNGNVFRMDSPATSPGATEPDWKTVPDVGQEIEEDPGGTFGGPWIWANIKPTESGSGYDHGLGFVDSAQVVDEDFGGRLQGVANTFT